MANISQERIQGHALAADRVQIKSVHSSPVKTLVTIRGQIISVSELCILFVLIQMNLYHVSLFFKQNLLQWICFKQEDIERTVKVGGVDTSVRSSNLFKDAEKMKNIIVRDGN